MPALGAATQADGVGQNVVSAALRHARGHAIANPLAVSTLGALGPLGLLCCYGEHVKRRSFLAALAAPLIAAPTLEEIERLTWRRRYWNGCSFEDVYEFVGREALKALEMKRVYARVAAIANQLDSSARLNYERYFEPRGRIGDTINVRRPLRFST